jgi:hypothetical protein
MSKGDLPGDMLLIRPIPRGARLFKETRRPSGKMPDYVTTVTFRPGRLSPTITSLELQGADQNTGI